MYHLIGFRFVNLVERLPRIFWLAFEPLAGLHDVLLLPVEAVVHPIADESGRPSPCGSGRLGA
jgi:hypothetical protein